MKILVVDDDKMMILSISRKLESKGYEVYTASNGMIALEIIEKKEPDLIICDVMMPGISGLTLLSLLKKFYFNKIPLILISSLNKTEVIVNSLGLGAYDFIVKPIDFKELLNKVAKYKEKLTPHKHDG